MGKVMGEEVGVERGSYISISDGKVVGKLEV